MFCAGKVMGGHTLGANDIWIVLTMVVMYILLHFEGGGAEIANELSYEYYCTFVHLN